MVGCESDINSDQKKILEDLAELPTSSYRFYFDERRQGLRTLVKIFVEVVAPAIHRLVKDITRRAAVLLNNLRKIGQLSRGVFRRGLCPTSQIVSHSIPFQSSMLLVFST